MNDVFRGLPDDPPGIRKKREWFEGFVRKDTSGLSLNLCRTVEGAYYDRSTETAWQTLLASSLETRAREFATHHHAAIGQIRKYTGEPYINHPAAVVELVRSVPHTQQMLAAAWLHDTVEDTDATIEDVLTEFGPEVADLVEMLTDVSKPEHGNRTARKAIDRDHTALASSRAKTIKLADLIDNSRSIIELDPAFAKTYLEEKRLLLDVLWEGDPGLFRMANEIVAGVTQ